MRTTTTMTAQKINPEKAGGGGWGEAGPTTFHIYLMER
jgi:hypothetical protein